jgi:uncharacterized protein YcbK (DUF882 family)
MIVYYIKGANIQVSEHFNQREFDCHCTRNECSTTPICTELVVLLENIRAVHGATEVLSGHRCKAHNAEVGGEKDSEHPHGTAADIKTLSSPSETADTANGLLIRGGVGKYDTFTHVDTRTYERARWDRRTKK